MSMEFKSPKRKRTDDSKSAAKERRAEKLLSQTQEEAEASRSQNRERMNASREEESQEKIEARRGQDRERRAASREEESQAASREEMWWCDKHSRAKKRSHEEFTG